MSESREVRSVAGVTAHHIPSSEPRKDAHARTHRADLADFEFDGDEAYVSVTFTIRCRTRWVIGLDAAGVEWRWMEPARTWIEDENGRELTDLRVLLDRGLGAVPALRAQLDAIEERLRVDTMERTGR